MLGMQRVSGVWTFLLAILLSITAGVIGFAVTASFLVTLGAFIGTMLGVVFLAQWV